MLGIIDNKMKAYRRLKKAEVVYKKPRQYPEFETHCQIAKYCALTFIEGRSMWHTTENSNSRGGVDAQRQQSKLKLMGVQTGFPDGIVFHDGNIICVEIKAPKDRGGRVSPEQKVMHERLRAMGFAVEVVYSFDEFKAVLVEYGVPTREVVLG